MYSAIASANAFGSPSATAQQLRDDIVQRCRAVADGHDASASDELASFLADIRDELTQAPGFEVLATAWRTRLARVLENPAWKTGERGALPTVEGYLEASDNFGSAWVNLCHWISTGDRRGHFFAFEKDLRDRYPSDSPRPHVLAGTLLLLISHHAARDPKVPERLRRRAEGSPTFRRATGKPLDEFTNAERLAMQEAAKADIRALEKRLARGQALLAEGVDPRQGGWESLANLVWAARHRILTTDALQANLPDRLTGWSEPLKELAGSPEGITSQSWLNLMLPVNRLLFPGEIDLQPFRILLLLKMTDCTPEELHLLELDDIQFSKEGVRVVQRKRRAGRVRADFHLAEDRPLAEGEQPGERTYPGSGNWDVPVLLRRLVGVTARIREVFEAPPRLFIAVESADYRKRVDARFASATARRCHYRRRTSSEHEISLEY